MEKAEKFASPLTFLFSPCHTEVKCCHCQAVRKPDKFSKCQQQIWRVGKTSCFQTLSSSQLLSSRRRQKQTLPCWPSVRSTFQQQLLSFCIVGPFPPGCLWMLSQAPCCKVKGMGVYNWWHFSLLYHERQAACNRKLGRKGPEVWGILLSRNGGWKNTGLPGSMATGSLLSACTGPGRNATSFQSWAL